LETKKSNKNGSNKNLLALTAKSPTVTPKAKDTKHSHPPSGANKSKSQSSDHSSTFEYVNPMSNRNSRPASATSAEKNLSRSDSFRSDRGDRISLPSFSPPTLPLDGSDSLDVGIALNNSDWSEHVLPDHPDKFGIALEDEDNFVDDRVSNYSEASVMNDDNNIFQYTMEVSMLEIYNEQVYDLLNDQFGGGQTDGVSMDLRLTPENMVVVPGLRQIKVHDMDDVEKVFNKGAKNRATSSTNLNASSSRSHLITIIEVTVEESDGTTVKGKLYLVDLAGSERINKSGAKGTVLKEAQYINKSLSSLGDVMEALDQKQKHIPFRNSKLTYLLQNALGGNAKTVMIFTVCPTDLTSDETLFTLQFAQRVRNITLTTAHRNISAKNLEISVKVLKSELREVKKKKIALEELLVETKKDGKKALEKANGPLESKIKMLEDFKRTQETSVATLTKQIHDLNSKIDEEKNAKQQSLFDLELTQRNLKRALEISKEYTSENDRLNTLVKTKDKELTSLKEAVAKTIISAQQQQQSFGNQHTPQSEGSASRRNSFSAGANSSQKNITIPELSTPEQHNMKRRNSDGDLHVSFTSPLSPSSPTNTKNSFTTFFAEKKIPTPQISPINRNSMNHVVSPKVVTPPSQNEPSSRRNNSIIVPTQQQLMESNSFDEEKSIMDEHSSHHISMTTMNATYSSPDRNMNKNGGK
jgi:hypothetical protein